MEYGNEMDGERTMNSPTVQTRDWRARTSQSRLGTLLVLVVTAGLVFGGVWVVKHRSPASGGGVTKVNLTGQTTGTGPVLGKPAQDFEATTVDGTKVSLSGYRGHPVWLTFGASWCSACRAESADIEAAYEKAKASGVVVLQIFIDENAAAVKSYGARVGLTFPLVADPDTTIASMYRVLGIPAHFFIDRNGVLRQTKAGGLSAAKMDAAIAEISR